MELDKNKLLKLYPQYTSVLGPYKRSDGRKHIVLNNCSLPNGTKGKTKTISYPKALVESNLGRTLLPNETIDHHDRDKTNDDLNNLKIKNRSEHSSIDNIRVKVEPIECPQCGNTFTPTRHQITTRAESKAGPFCSRKCSGKYGKGVQNGDSPMDRNKIQKTYYQLNKDL